MNQKTVRRTASSAENGLVFSGSTALLHDWLTGFRGGEWILEAFCEMAPKAPLHTLLHIPGSTSPTIENRPIHTSFLNKVPGIGRHYRKFLPLFPAAAESLSVRRDTELMISTSHCVIKGVPKPERAFHLSYVHSPMRYMYDQFDSYFGHESGAPIYQRLGAQAFRGFLTNWDRESNRGVDLLVANSKFVRERIRRFYERDAEVVHPFVEFKDFTAGDVSSLAKEDFFLMVTAFAPNKRVDLAIAAFNELGLPLKIIGGGQDESRLRAMAGPTIEFLGGVSRADVISHMIRARAFIFPGVEDFGITPLESLAAKTPVIAFKAGGVLETLTEADSVFFDKLEASSLVEAVRRFEARAKATEFEFSTSRLEAFSRERFKKEVLDLLP